MSNTTAEIASMTAVVIGTFDGEEDDHTIAAAMAKMHAEGFRPSDFITPTRTTRHAVGQFVAGERA